MKIDVAIEDVRDAELEVAKQLDALGQRHEADHDVFHLANTLQGLCRANLESLAPAAERYGVRVAPGEVPADHGEGGAEDGLVLVQDLRELHLAYAEASIDWVILGQGAQAAKDEDLLSAVSASHPRTLRGMKWTVTRLKEAAPQALTS